MTFTEKVQSMKASEIIMAMVNGLNVGYYEVDFHTFGEVEDKVCYGCAATHCVTEIHGRKFGVKTISYRDKLIGESQQEFLKNFEIAIDTLRWGYIIKYNRIAKEEGFATIKNIGFILPYLSNYNWKKNLHKYEELAKLEAKEGN